MKIWTRELQRRENGLIDNRTAHADKNAGDGDDRVFRLHCSIADDAEIIAVTRLYRIQCNMFAIGQS